MRSKFIISSLVAFIAALGMMAAPAFADWSLGGYINTTFGMLSEDDGTDTSSAMASFGRTQLDLKASDGPVSGAFRLRFHDSSTTTATMRHQVSWKATDTVAVTVAPSHFGFAGAGTNANQDFFRVSGVGASAVDGVFPQYSVPAIKVDVGLGGLAVGAGIVTTCGVLCYGDTLEGDDQTIVAHVKGSAGAISYNGAFATGSGSASGDSDGDEVDDYAEVSVSGTALQAGLTYDLGTMAIGADYGTYTKAAAEDAGSADDTVYSFLGLALGADAFGVDFHSISTTVGDADPSTTTEIDAHYKIKVGDSSFYGVEFRNAVSNSGAEGADDTTKQFIAFGLRTNF